MRIDAQKFLILGATSAIAQAVARQAVDRKCGVALVARDAAHLEAIAGDLRTRGGTVVCIQADLSCPAEHEQILEKAWRGLGKIDVALIVYGLYAETDAAEIPDTLIRLLNTNFVSAAHLALAIVERFSAQGRGRLGVITSVAGDRGRKRNYVYASAKGGLSVFVQGLDHRLGNGPVQVLDIKLGMVDTPMTAHMPPSPLKISPQKAATLIVAGLEKNASVIYVPWFWRWIMLIIRSLPRSLMNRLDIFCLSG